MKSTVGTRFCPVVASLLSLLLGVFPAGCGSGDPEPVQEEAAAGQPRVMAAVPVDGFSVMPAPPDTVELAWSGEGPATVDAPLVIPGESVSPGDTLVMLTEDLRLVELERLSMRVQMALAALHANPGDSTLQARADSLEALEDSLLLASAGPMLAQVAGDILSISVEEGDEIRPGDILFSLTTGSGALYIISPPDDVIMNIWPESAGELILIETGFREAVYSGLHDPPVADFSMVRSVGRNALFEDGLRTLLISVDGDTLEVIRAGTNGNEVVLLMPGHPEGTEFMTWGS